MKGFCDCGKPATKKDGSGYSCDECRIVVAEAQAAIEDFIIEQRRQPSTVEDLEEAKVKQKKQYYS